MKELIKIKEENGQKLVSARELYLGLGLDRSQWSRWNKKNIVKNEFFKENIDWVGVRLNVEGNKTMDFAISLEFAKHLAMMAKTKKSHEYRNYFIECEKQLIETQKKANLLLNIYNGGQEGILSAKQLTEIEVREATRPLLNTISEQKPMVEFANQVGNSSDSVDVGTFAKMVKDEHIDIGRNRLFSWLRENKYLMKNNVPYQNKIEQGLFKVIETYCETPYGSKLNSKTLITGKGQIILVEKLRSEFKQESEM